MANWAIESDKQLTKDTLRLQAVVYDRRLQELRKLAQSPKTRVLQEHTRAL